MIVWKVIQNGNSKKIIKLKEVSNMRRFHGIDDAKRDLGSASELGCTALLLLSSTNIPEKEVLAGFAVEVIYSLFAKQSKDWDLLHEDLEQIDYLDIEEMDINRR
ncbi:hypothetical protein Tco_0620306 [Tanacetum coccineum]